MAGNIEDWRRRIGWGGSRLVLFAIATLLISAEISSMQASARAEGAPWRDRMGMKTIGGPRLRGGSDQPLETTRGDRDSGDVGSTAKSDRGGGGGGAGGGGGGGIFTVLNGLKGLVLGNRGNNEGSDASFSLKQEEDNMFEALRTQQDKECSSNIARMLASGCSPNAIEASRCNYGPVHLAADRGLLQTIRVLYENGADMNMRGKHGQTPLHVAASRGQEDAVKVLLGLKAKIDEKDHMGWTALHQASYFGHVHIVELLMRHGANRNATSVQGWNAADVCCKGLGQEQTEGAELERRILTVLPPATNRTIDIQDQFRTRGAVSRENPSKNSLEKFAEGRSKDISFKDRFASILVSMHDEAEKKSVLAANMTQDIDAALARHRGDRAEASLLALFPDVRVRKYQREYREAVEGRSCRPADRGR